MTQLIAPNSPLHQARLTRGVRMSRSRKPLGDADQADLQQILEGKYEYTASELFDLPAALAVAAAALLLMLASQPFTRWLDILPLGAPTARSLGIGLDYKWSDRWWMEVGLKTYLVYTRIGKGYNSVSGFFEPYLGMTVAF